MNISESLQQILANLRSALPELRGVMVAATDGMVISHAVTGGDPNRMAAMVATALGLGKRMCESFSAGQFSETSVSGDQGLVFIYAAGTKGVLAVIAPAGGNVGLLHLEARSAAQNIATILG